MVSWDAGSPRDVLLQASDAGSTSNSSSCPPVGTARRSWPPRARQTTSPSFRSSCLGGSDSGAGPPALWQSADKNLNVRRVVSPEWRSSRLERFVAWREGM